MTEPGQRRSPSLATYSSLQTRDCLTSEDKPSRRSLDLDVEDQLHGFDRRVDGADLHPFTVARFVLDETTGVGRLEDRRVVVLLEDDQRTADCHLGRLFQAGNAHLELVSCLLEMASVGASLVGDEERTVASLSDLESRLATVQFNNERKRSTASYSDLRR